MLIKLADDTELSLQTPVGKDSSNKRSGWGEEGGGWDTN